MKKLKRISSIIGIFTMLFALPNNVYALENGQSSKLTIDEYCSSDEFSYEGLQTLFPKYYSLCLENKEHDKIVIENINKNLDQIVKVGKKEALHDVKRATAVTSNSTLGTYGDILVNLAIDSGSIGFAGHAAIVSNDSNYTIESYAQSWSPIGLDGVQIYDNNWGTSSGSLLVRPYNATSSQYSTAASFAYGKINLPYNWNFFDKNTTSKYYCSQLVWQAWNSAGINTETGSIPNAIIAPADLVNSSNTYVVTHIY